MFSLQFWNASWSMIVTEPFVVTQAWNWPLESGIVAYATPAETSSTPHAASSSVQRLLRLNRFLMITPKRRCHSSVCENAPPNSERHASRATGVDQLIGVLLGRVREVPRGEGRGKLCSPKPPLAVRPILPLRVHPLPWIRSGNSHPLTL